MRRIIPRWRKMTWVLLAWTVLIVVWVAVGSSGSGESVDECVAEGILTRQECQDAVDAGTGIGVFLVLVFGFLGFIVLGLIWFMTRPSKRVCPHCGNDVKKGLTACKSCGYDFTIGGKPPVPEPAAPPPAPTASPPQ